MATKANAQTPPPGEEEGGDSDAAANETPPKKSGLVGRLLGPVIRILAFANPLKILKLPRKLQVIVAGGLLLVLAGGGAAFYFLWPAAKAGDEATAESVQIGPAKLPANTVAFFDIPDIVVNIQTAESAPPAYLKLSVALELENPGAKAAIEPVMPRIIDQFQTYLRELRVEDIRGSAGVMRLKEELLRRVNLAVAPTPVHDVLLKEMIVQ